MVNVSWFRVGGANQRGSGSRPVCVVFSKEHDDRQSNGFRASGFRFPVSGFGFRYSDFGFGISGFNFGSAPICVVFSEEHDDLLLRELHVQALQQHL